MPAHQCQLGSFRLKLQSLLELMDNLCITHTGALPDDWLVGGNRSINAPQLGQPMMPMSLKDASLAAVQNCSKAALASSCTACTACTACFLFTAFRGNAQFTTKVRPVSEMYAEQGKLP